MNITLKNTDFSNISIGSENTYFVDAFIDNGVSHNIPKYVEKNSSVSWEILIADNYELNMCSCMIGDDLITPEISDDGKTITFNTVITNNVHITVYTNKL